MCLSSALIAIINNIYQVNEQNVVEEEKKNVDCVKAKWSVHNIKTVSNSYANDGHSF